MLIAPALFEGPDPFLGALSRVERKVVTGDRPRALVHYQDRPLEFFEEILGVPIHTMRWSENPGYDKHSWDGTTDPLEAIVQGLVDWKSVGAESGTGTGKSFELACIILWFLGTWDGARVFTFAPKEDQLRLYSWAELSKLWPRFKLYFPTAQLSDLRIRMMPGSDEWGAWGWPVQVRSGEEVATNAAGMHARHMLLIYEEGQGIEHAVLEAGEQTCTAPHNMQLVVGNPDNELDGLHQHCIKPDVVHVRISALDHPNVVTGDPDVVPGAVSTTSIDRRRARLGEGSRLFQSRVRGISPKEALDALIRYEWIRAAVDRYNDPAFRIGLPGRGVDVAQSENGDRGAIARGLGACLLEVEAFPCPDASKLGVRVAVEIALEGIDPMHVGVDAAPVGAGCINKLRELKLYIRALNNGSKPLPRIDEDVLVEKGRAVLKEEVFFNFRAQSWWQLRMDLQHGRIALPDDEELHRDLLAPKWESKNGKLILEPKEAIRSRLRGRSPDKGDAVVNWNWVRYRRPVEKEEAPVSAWDPAVLEYEALESRRVRSMPPRRRALVNPTILERID